MTLAEKLFIMILSWALLTATLIGVLSIAGMFLNDWRRARRRVQ